MSKSNKWPKFKLYFFIYISFYYIGLWKHKDASTTVSCDKICFKISAVKEPSTWTFAISFWMHKKIISTKFDPSQKIVPTFPTWIVCMHKLQASMIRIYLFSELGYTHSHLTFPLWIFKCNFTWNIVLFIVKRLIEKNIILTCIT